MFEDHINSVINSISFNSPPKNLIYNKVVDMKNLAGFSNGVISAGPGGHKGEFLNKFFEVSGYAPDKFLFVDDDPMYLDQVTDTFLEKGVEFLCIKYTAAEDIKFDPAVAEKEARTFLGDSKHRDLIDIIF